MEIFGKPVKLVCHKPTEAEIALHQALHPETSFGSWDRFSSLRVRVPLRLTFRWNLGLHGLGLYSHWPTALALEVDPVFRDAAIHKAFRVGK